MAYQISTPIDTLFTPQANDGTAFSWRGTWIQGRTYNENEAVSYTYNNSTSSYRAVKNTTANPALNPLDWELIASGGAGSGDAGVDNVIKAPFSFGDATPKLIHTIPADTLIVTATVFITTPFDSVLSTLSLGDIANNSRLLNSSQIYGDEQGEYEAKPGYKYISPTDIYLYINLGSGNTTGNGYVVLEI